MNKTIILIISVYAISSSCFAQEDADSFFNTIGKPKFPPTHPVQLDSSDIDDYEYMEEGEYDESLLLSSNAAPSLISGYAGYQVALPLSSIEITSLFGLRKDPLNPKRKKMHYGLDLKARYEKVYSMLPGIVVSVGYSVNGGNYVKIKHGICTCTYMHLSGAIVKTGDKVKAGDIVAISGNSGKRTTGAHLHIACHLYDENDPGRKKFFDPLLLLGFIAEKMNQTQEEITNKGEESDLFVSSDI